MYTGAQTNLGDLTPYLTYGSDDLVIHTCRLAEILYRLDQTMVEAERCLINIYEDFLFKKFFFVMINLGQHPD
jgi:hypothetical protein